jgi:transcriptional regulator with XRE-family HTH domain
MSRAKPPQGTLDRALAKMVRDLLQQRGWSQHDLARRLGVSQSAVSMLIKRKRRQDALTFYVRLARIFGVPLSELIARMEGRTVEEPSWAPEPQPTVLCPHCQGALVPTFGQITDEGDPRFPFKDYQTCADCLRFLGEGPIGQTLNA